MDELDKKILWHLDFEGRVVLSDLAHHLKISKQLLSFRVGRLKREGVIGGCAPVIDLGRLGYLTFRVFFRYKGFEKEHKEEILRYFLKHPHAHWVVDLAGAWDFEVVFSAPNSYRFNEMLKKIRQDLGKYFSRYNASVSTVNYFFRRDYLLDRKKRASGKPISYYGLDPHRGEWQILDQQILAELSRDCDQSNEAIGRALGVTSHTVKNHIEALEQGGVLQSYRTLFSLSKLNRRHFKAMVWLSNLSPEEESKIYEICGRESFVIYLTEIFGDWQFEIEAEVQEQQEVVDLLRRLKSEYPEKVLDYNLVEMTKEHKFSFFTPFVDEFAGAANA